MNVFRLSAVKYGRDLSGLGAEKAGGRWNSKGVPLIYTSASRALCTAELAVHLPLGNVPPNYRLITLEIPDDAIAALDTALLPARWNTFPHLDSTQKIGDRFVSELKFLVLKVPSAVVNGDFNYLINPRHPDISLVRILDDEEYAFDPRLFKR